MVNFNKSLKQITSSVVDDRHISEDVRSYLLCLEYCHLLAGIMRVYTFISTYSMHCVCRLF